MRAQRQQYQVSLRPDLGGYDKHFVTESYVNTHFAYLQAPVVVIELACMTKAIECHPTFARAFFAASCAQCPCVLELHTSIYRCFVTLSFYSVRVCLCSCRAKWRQNFLFSDVWRHCRAVVTFASSWRYATKTWRETATAGKQLNDQSGSCHYGKSILKRASRPRAEVTSMASSAPC